jgi:hypothetical protein
VVRRALDRLRDSCPNHYARGSNAIALAELYAHRWRSWAQTADAYPDDFRDFHDVGDWDNFARAVLAHTRAALARAASRPGWTPARQRTARIVLDPTAGRARRAARSG